MSVLALVSPPIQTISDLVAVFLCDVNQRAARAGPGSLATVTAQNYCYQLNAFAGAFGKCLLRDCGQHDLTRWLAANPQWESLHTRLSNIRSILTCFRWAVDEGLIKACPYKMPKQLRGQASETRRPATKDEFEALMEWAKPRVRTAIEFVYLTGCRTCEMRALKWSDLRLEGQAPHVVLLEHKTVKQTGLPRVFALCERAVALLGEIRAKSRSEYVFVNCVGDPWTKSAFCHNFLNTARRAGLDDGIIKRVSCYCFRHTYAVDAIKMGVTADAVSKQLGNSREIVERVYASHVGRDLIFVAGVAKRIADGRK